MLLIAHHTLYTFVHVPLKLAARFRLAVLASFVADHSHTTFAPRRP